MVWLFIYFHLFHICPSADINVDISKPLKANFSFVKLDQIKQFLKKIRNKSDYEIQEEDAAAADSFPKNEDALTSPCCQSRIAVSEDHGDEEQKVSIQENLWRSISCRQNISIKTTQMVVSVETYPDPVKPCLLASFSNLSGNLNIKGNSKTKGKKLWGLQWQ